MGKNRGQSSKAVASSAATKDGEKLDDSAISLNKDGDIMLRIHAKPNAKTTRVVDIGASEIELAIAAPPRDGQANETLINAITEIVGLKRNEITLDTGARSRSKILLINSARITMEQLREKLERNAAGKD